MSTDLKELLKAGTHFGHKTSRWNPKMKEFIFGARNNIHIINLEKTLECLNHTVDALTEMAQSPNYKILIVGTKLQAQHIVEDAAKRSGMHYVNQRWLGGTLTNFATLKKSVTKYTDLCAVLDNEKLDILKKERLVMTKKRQKQSLNFDGILNMTTLPDLLIVVDIIKEKIAVQEAQKLGIPIIAIVDSNTDPSNIDFPIPGNDDSAQTIELIVNILADAVVEAKESSMQDSAEVRK